jgi:hypothetical protein
MQHPETVMVENPAEPGGYMIINKSDMTQEHKLWKAPEPTADQFFADVAANNTLAAAKKKAK